MIVTCIACGQAQFYVDVNDVHTHGVISFCCPACGTITGVQRRIGGGVIVAIDKGANPLETILGSDKP